MKPFDPRLLKYAAQTRKYIAFLVAVGFLATLLVAVQTFLISDALSSVFYHRAAPQTTARAAIGVGAVFLLRACLHYLQNSVAHRSALRVIGALREKVLTHAAALGERWLAEGNTAAAVTLVTRGLDDLEAYFVSFLPQLFLCATAMPMLLLIIFWLDWISALTVIFCIPLVPLFMILIGKMTANYSQQRLAAMQQLGSQLLDLLAGLTTLKAVGREMGPEKKVRELGNAFTEKTMQTLYVAFLSGAALEFITTLSTAIIAVEVGFRMVAGQMLLFEGLAVIMLTPEVFKPLREVGTQFHASADGVAAAEKTFGILEIPLTPHSGKKPLPDPDTAVIRFRDLCVYAPHRTTVAPAHLNAEILPRRVTVLKGKSGAGKSTAVSVLLGLLNPDSGTVTVGGIPLSELDLHSWWEQIAWVPQRPALVAGTVAENIGVSDPEKLARAAHLTGFDAVLDTLPAGWETPLGQGGVGLSVGQRQRLALTRALVSGKKIIILDEPSAHLDSVSEEYILNTVSLLKSRGHTVIVIAHRKAVEKRADTIITVCSATRTKQSDKGSKEPGNALLPF